MNYQFIVPWYGEPLQRCSKLSLLYVGSISEVVHNRPHKGQRKPF